MEGMNQHLEFQIELAGKSGGGGGGSPQGNKEIFDNVGETPDYISDIGSMVPIERPE